MSSVLRLASPQFSQTSDARLAVTFKVRIIIKKCKTPVLKTVKLIIFLVIMKIKPILKQKKDNIVYIF